MPYKALPLFGDLFKAIQGMTSLRDLLIAIQGMTSLRDLLIAIQGMTSLTVYKMTVFS